MQPVPWKSSTSLEMMELIDKHEETWVYSLSFDQVLIQFDQ